MKKILVTGGAGFIGSNFIHYCLNKNDILMNYDSLTYAGNLNNFNNIINKQNYQFIKGDICDETLFSKCLKEFKPDFIVNFAAESHVDRSIDGPECFVNTNILGTYKILNESYKYYKELNKSNFKFIHISTDEVYGSLGENGFFTENTPYNPSSPYSASKASSDHLVNAWNKTYNFPTNITNCSNNYGPYQFPEKLIPLMINNCLDNKKLPVYGNGKNIRDWLYVEDHCRAIYKVMHDGKIGETYNIGGNEEKTNIDIITTICDLLDEIKPSSKLESYKDLIIYVKDRPGHDYRYAIDASKIFKNLKWEPSESFESGIKKTIKWYIENLKWVEDIRNNKYNLDRLGVIK